MTIKIFGGNTIEELEEKVNKYLSLLSEINIIDVQFIPFHTTETLGNAEPIALTTRYGFYAMVRRK